MSSVLPLLVGGIVSFVTSSHVHYFSEKSIRNRGTPCKQRIEWLENLPLIHLEFEELELDRRELDKQEVEQPEVDRFDLDEPGVGKPGGVRSNLICIGGRYTRVFPGFVVVAAA
ncbi:hypothetical protein Tco_1371035 [Tanacetum coccineum]